MQNNGDFHAYARIITPKVPVGWATPSGPESQPAASSESGAYGDWSAYLQRVQGLNDTGTTGDPRIDNITEIFSSSALRKSAREIGTKAPAGTRATVFGTFVHVDFGRRVRELDLPGIGQTGVEHSLSLEGFARYGLAGTVRTDILLTDQLQRPLAIYDLKTGDAQLTPRRMQELRAAAKAPNVPIIELRYRE